MKRLTINKSIVLLCALLPIFASAAYATSPIALRANNDGVTSLTNKEYDKAITYFRRALTLDHDYDLARSNLAIAFNARGLQKGENKWWAEASEDFKKSLKVKQNPIVYHNDAIANLMLRNFDKVLEDEDQAGPSARSTVRGFALLGNRKTADAIKEFEKETTSIASQHVGLSLAYRQQGNGSKSKQELQLAQKSDEYKKNFDFLNSMASISGEVLPTPSP